MLIINKDLFNKKVPNRALSCIWQAFGCRHSLLQATDNYYQPPDVPALLTSGFVRWQSMQLLLYPQEHVPYLQFAVQNWDLRHPDSGEPFPTPLPSTSFPSEPDPEVTEWHMAVGEGLRAQATRSDAPPLPRFPVGASRHKRSPSPMI